MLRPASMKLPSAMVKVPISAPPGLEPSIELSPPPGLPLAKPVICSSWAFVPLHDSVCHFCEKPPSDTYIQNSAGETSDDTSVGSDGQQSDTASSVCDNDYFQASSFEDSALVIDITEMDLSKQACGTCHTVDVETACESELKADAPELVPLEKTSRTALQSSALEFKPQLPFLPMAEVVYAWQQWHVATNTMHKTMELPRNAQRCMPARSKQTTQSRRRMGKEAKRFS